MLHFLLNKFSGLLTATFLLWPLLCPAQQQMYAGFSAGPVVSDIEVEVPLLNLPDNNTRVGYNARLFAGMPLGQKLGVQAEVSWWTQSVEVAGTETANLPALPNSTVDLDITLDIAYLQTALYGRFETGNKVKVYLLAGPFAGLLTQARTNGELSITSNGNTFPVAYDGTDQRDEFEQFSFGISGGAGAAVNAGPGQLLLEFRGDLGLTNVASEENSQFSDVQAGALAINLGYRVWW